MKPDRRLFISFIASCSLAGLAGLGASALAAAPNENSTTPLMPICQDDIDKHCRESQPGRETIRCLIRNESGLTGTCQQFLQRLAPMHRRTPGISPFSGAMGGMSFIGPPVPSISYSGSMFPENSHTDLSQHRASLTVPIHAGAKESIGLSLAGSILRFSAPPVLSETGTHVPDELYRFDIGTQYSHRLSGDRTVGTRFSAGSASERPFSSSREVTFNLSGSYSFPGSDMSQWFIFVLISNNNPIANYFPIPGFAYLYRSERFTGIFGLPFASLQWTPVADWAVSFSFFGPLVTLEAIYGERRGLQSFIGLNWNQQSFLRTERLHEKDRLFVEEKKTYLGVRSPLSRFLSLELQAGYSFDRLVYEGPKLRKRLRGNAELGDSLYASWFFSYQF